MTSSQLCPFCHNTSVASGHYHDPESMEGYARPLFEPDDIKVPALRKLLGNFHATVDSKANACLHCGKIWADLNLEGLKEVFRKYGTDESKARFSFDLGR